jgi:hypothetical protein
MIHSQSVSCLLVHSGCCNKTPQPGQLLSCRQGLITVVETASPISRASIPWGWSGPAPSSPMDTFSLCPHIVKEQRGVSGST